MCKYGGSRKDVANRSGSMEGSERRERWLNKYLKGNFLEHAWYPLVYMG